MPRREEDAGLEVCACGGVDGAFEGRGDGGVGGGIEGLPGGSYQGVEVLNYIVVCCGAGEAEEVYGEVRWFSVCGGDGLYLADLGGRVD